MRQIDFWHGSVVDDLAMICAETMRQGILAQSMFGVCASMICAKDMRQRILAQWLRDAIAAMFGVCAGYAPGTCRDAIRILDSHLPNKKSQSFREEACPPTVTSACNTMQANKAALLMGLMISGTAARGLRLGGIR